jgi:serine/threonine-protein kinase
MLTGRRVFEQQEISDTLAFVLTKDPDWSALPAGTPASIRRLLRRCLVKDRSARLTDMGGARLEIDEAHAESGQPTVSAGISSNRSRAIRLLTVAVGALAILALGAVAMWMTERRQQRTLPVTRTVIGVAPAERLLSGFALDSSMGQGRPSRTTMAFAPDGRSIVFSAERNGRVQLFLRRLDQLEATPITGTEGASNPFFSPNGESLGFHAAGALKRIPVSGGAAVTVCDVDYVFGASWGPTEQIVYATVEGGLWRVAATGGSKPESLTKLQSGEVSHRLPQLLPDGQTVLFTSTKSIFPTWEDTRVVAQSLATGQQKVLIEGGADARYVSTGHLVYMRRGTLMAAPFDATRLEVTGAAVGLLADVMQAANIQPNLIDSGAGQFAISASGALAYVSGGVFPQDRWSMVWVDRTGKVEPLNLPRGAYLAPRLSPDGKRVVFNTTTGDWDLMVYDVARGLTTRLPMRDDQSIGVWSPDSSRVAFGSGLAGTGKVFIRSADGNGAPEEVQVSADAVRGMYGATFPNTWTPDGRSLVVWVPRGGGLLLAPIKEKGAPHSLFGDPTGAVTADFSPDGRWLAYTSGGPLTSEIYVRPYPALDRRVQVAGQGSSSPVWQKGGRELYYLENASGEAASNIRVMAMSVTTTPTFSASAPRKLFEGPFRVDGPFRSYDVTADGQRFLFVRAAEQPAAHVNQIVLVQNWTEELKARVPVK